MFLRSSLGRGMLATGLAVGMTSACWADAYNTPVPNGPFFQVPPSLDGLPAPPNVPGKEFLHRDLMLGTNHDDLTLPAPFPGMSLRWDGLGGTQNGIVFPFNSDAIAAERDLLFTDVLADQVPIVVAVQGSNNIWYHRSSASPTPGAVGLWATPRVIDRSTPNLGLDDFALIPSQLYGIELWGPEAAPDGLIGSPDTPGGNQVVNALGVPIHSAFALSDAIRRGPAGGQILDFASFAADLNLDAMMFFDEAIIFSIAPSAFATFDGGELFVWDGTALGAATFLSHGGRVWDTANDVSSLFGFENIVGLEAVAIPEPATLALLAVGSGLLLRRRRRA